MKTQDIIIPSEIIEKSILLIRGEKVILDSVLADMYSVELRTLIQAVKRNKDRFPEDFVFNLSQDEIHLINNYKYNKTEQNQIDANLRSQFVISSLHGGRRYAPYVFTEQGVAMLSCVLRSKTAVKVNVEIMRTFVRLRKLILSNQELSIKLDSMESKYDTQFKVVFDAIRELMSPLRTTKKNKIGFGT